jgi:ribonuclease T2
MFRSLGRPTAAAVALVIATGIAGAQDPRQNEPGQFDFYVLSLSWSPSFCEAAGARDTAATAMLRTPLFIRCARPMAAI